MIFSRTRYSVPSSIFLPDEAAQQGRGSVIAALSGTSKSWLERDDAFPVDFMRRLNQVSVLARLPASLKPAATLTWTILYVDGLRLQFISNMQDRFLRTSNSGFPDCLFARDIKAFIIASYNVDAYVGVHDDILKKRNKYA